ncbi:MAG: threonine--tRNA ligase, partial [Patescibacteria group bacterium]
MAKKEEISNIRHTLSHLLAAAVTEIYPDAKPAFGPPTETGFYYDFDFGKDTPKEEDLKIIEKKMRELLSSWDEIKKENISKEKALEIFKNNPYKKELVEEIADKGEEITVYTSGEFTDLCEGGHVKNAENIPTNSFKLSGIAGAYWRGDENNKMLTRIYGLAFQTKKEL